MAASRREKRNARRNEIRREVQSRIVPKMDCTRAPDRGEDRSGSALAIQVRWLTVHLHGSRSVLALHAGSPTLG